MSSAATSRWVKPVSLRAFFIFEAKPSLYIEITPCCYYSILHKIFVVISVTFLLAKHQQKVYNIGEVKKVPEEKEAGAGGYMFLDLDGAIELKNRLMSTDIEELVKLLGYDSWRSCTCDLVSLSKALSVLSRVLGEGERK